MNRLLFAVGLVCVLGLVFTGCKKGPAATEKVGPPPRPLMAQDIKDGAPKLDPGQANCYVCGKPIKADFFFDYQGKRVYLSEEMGQVATDPLEKVWSSSKRFRTGKTRCIEQVLRSSALPVSGCQALSDAKMARRVLGWEPKVSRREGLARTIPYFRESLKQQDSSGNRV